MLLLCGMQVGQLVRNFTDQAVALGQVILQDGKWHMLTLTTLWDGTPGYAMLVDGQLAGVLNGNYTYTGTCQALYSYILAGAALGQQPCKPASMAVLAAGLKGALILGYTRVGRQLPITQRSTGNCRIYYFPGPVMLCGYSTHDTKHGRRNHLTHLAPSNQANSPMEARSHH